MKRNEKEDEQQDVRRKDEREKMSERKSDLSDTEEWGCVSDNGAKQAMKGDETWMRKGIQQMETDIVVYCCG